MTPRDLLRAMFDAAVAAADPARCVPPHLPAPPRGRTYVVAIGKAAAAMAKAVEERWTGRLSGIAITRYGHGLPCRRIEVVEAGHPLPDESGLAAAQRALAGAEALGPDDLLLALISGGGSALLALPARGVSLADKQALTRTLLASGATIGEINCLRKHLSAVKGGRLAAAAAPARVATLAISDVPGDDPAIIASGPTVPDPTTLADARAIVAKYAIDLPPAIASALADPANETPKPKDPVDIRVVARPRDSLEAAGEVACARGYEPVLLGDALEGEARELGAAHARLAGRPGPCVLISGGETTVTLRTATGRGGRNAEYLLALAIALAGRPGVHAIACDTDGIDGSEDNAGAVVGPDSLARARAAGVDPAACLARHDAYGFFAALGDLVTTGPTRTNVNDFRAVLVEAGAGNPSRL
jgi:hydroxypyruvate reductase